MLGDIVAGLLLKSQYGKRFHEIFFVWASCDMMYDGDLNCIFLIQDELIIDIADKYQYNAPHLS